MLNPKFNKPEIIANAKFQIQIVDTPKTSKTRASISFAGFCHQFNRTLLIEDMYSNYAISINMKQK
jgi:hypothetical protein